ncbi:MAG TPA: DUF4350 domain-containing protein, partial [Cyanobacteria bacterium UBA11166]|nr:DUF4350 domain-containing protein [Cyanobacteria bacterium UBA11166]
NTLVILGVDKPVTNAPFSTMHNSPEGKIKIETTRRHKQNLTEGKDSNQILVDKFGAIV